MGNFTVNGELLLKAKISEPLSGPWHADIEVDVETEFAAGPITLDLDTVQLVGAVRRQSVYAGRLMARIVGGAGGLKKVLDTKQYLASPLKIILDDILTESGETISDTSADIISLVQNHWTRTKGQAAYGIEAVAKKSGNTWRVQRDGKVLLTVDTFPTVEVEGDITNRDPTIGWLEFSSKEDAPTLVPGITFQGERVIYVTTDAEAGSVRQRVYFA